MRHLGLLIAYNFEIAADFHVSLRFLMNYFKTLTARPLQHSTASTSR